MSGADVQFSDSDRALMVVNDVVVHGSTRMHKYGFLLAQQYRKETGRVSKTTPSSKFYDDWKPLWFGPFSKILAKDIDDCVKHSLIYKEPDNPYSNSFWYGLTVEGRAQWRKMMDRFNGDMTAMRGKVVRLQKVSLTGILESIYSSYPEYTIESVIKNKVH